jgi:2-desacetyl-2-hydroxyethyl bacteriochlorophyllide A dehydrogenase
MAVRAALLRDIPASALQVADVPDITPVRPDDLLLRVESCGICGTDLHLMDGQSFHPELPFILGHEPVGTVVGVGSSELEGWLGTRVTATIFVGCGRCSMCRAEAERLCPNLQEITGLLHAAGGYAEYLVIRASQAVEVPSALSSKAAASLTDAGPTAVNAVRAALTRQPTIVVIVGGGPVGFLCAELLHLAGQDFVVVEPNALRRDALSQGGYRVASQLDEVTVSPDTVIDCAAAPDVVPWALHHLSARGVFVAVGFQAVPNFELIPVVRKEIALLGIRSGSRDDLIRILDLAATRRIRMPGLGVWTLEEINDALHALRTGRVEGKAMVQIDQRRQGCDPVM